MSSYYGGTSMRNDINDAISFLSKEDAIMFNKAELARRFGCDPRTIDRYLKIQSGELIPVCPAEIRKLIYTTNSIENFNRQLRKVTKSKTIRIFRLRRAHCMVF